MWVKMVTCIRKVASEEFGVTKGGKCETKETWWWNEKFKRLLRRRKSALDVYTWIGVRTT
jgi:hypothetical protein